MFPAPTPYGSHKIGGVELRHSLFDGWLASNDRRKFHSQSRLPAHSAQAQSFSLGAMD
jgi:hypothetical protein